MTEEEPRLSLQTENSFAWALCFEVGLGLLALLVGQSLTKTWPAERLEWPVEVGSVVVGISSAFPVLVVMVVIRHLSWQPLRELRGLMDEQIIPMFRGLRTSQLLFLSLAAGWGEELLFRGLMQAEITNQASVIVGIGTASLVFAVVHFITPMYFVIAFLMGVYLGWLYWYFDSLWVPILSHTTYDFLILLFLLRGHRDA